MFSTSIATLEHRSALSDLLARRRGAASYELGEQPLSNSVGQIVKIRANRIVSRLSAMPVARLDDRVAANFGALATAFARHLQQAEGISVTDEQSARYGRALALDPPRSRRSLYYLSREAFITEAGQVAAFNEQFAEIFGAPAGADRYREHAPALEAVAG
ncbi:MAG: hypothetical protein QOG15_381 [Solirubrobacteraceae bacterium]|nr:hypothetical protein [Solirubrobacteraceae bacterium]